MNSAGEVDSAEAARQLRVRRETLHAYNSDPDRAPEGFPRPRPFGRALAYRQDEIDEYLQMKAGAQVAA